MDVHSWMETGFREGEEDPIASAPTFRGVPGTKWGYTGCNVYSFFILILIE